MAFTNLNPAVIGDATKKSDLTKCYTNTFENKDRIIGDNAEGTGIPGHTHNGTDSLALTGIVAQSYLKTSTQEVSQLGTTLTNKTLSSVGEYGFYPQVRVDLALESVECKITDTTGPVTTSYITNIAIRSSAALATAYARVRYVQASRDEPVVWLHFDDGGDLIESVFDPECNGSEHPFIDYRDLPVGHKIVVIQVKDSEELKKHLWENASKLWFLEQVHLGLFLGNIKINEEQGTARLDKDSAPSLHHEDIKVAKFEFVKPVEEVNNEII